MLQKMQADILFLDPTDLSPATAALVERGFDVENLDYWIDEAGPTVFIRARINTEIDEDHFHDWVQSVVEPLGGDTIEAGLADPLPPQFA
jgi:hypothetical protein